MVHQARRYLPAIILIGVLAFSACGSSSTNGTGTATAVSATNTPAPTATQAPAPTATTAPATTCAQLPGFSGAGSVSSIHGMQLPTFPTNTVYTQVSGNSAGVGQYASFIANFCSPNETTALNVTTGKGPMPFLNEFAFYGWDPTANIFLNSTTWLAESCPSGGNCFAYNYNVSNFTFNTGQEYANVSNITDNGNQLITYKIAFYGPPTAPTCTDPNFASYENAIYHQSPIYPLYLHNLASSSTDPYAGIQLPPMSRMYSNNAMGVIGYTLCSSGTATSLNTFMTNEMTSLGWHTTTSQYCMYNACYQSPNAAFAKNVISWSTTNPSDWNIAYHNPNI